MADAAEEQTLTEANILALTGEDALEDVRDLTLRNHKLRSFDQGDTSRLINLQILSLSHNLLTSLAGFQHLHNLTSVNVNFNALTSLDGLQRCGALQHLFAANNRIRDLTPLLLLPHLHTLHLLRNQVASLEAAASVLGQLAHLRELELAGNPCCLCADYKHRLVLQLELESLDGDSVNALDYDLAHEFYAGQGGPPAGLGLRVDILTLEDADALSAGPTAAAVPEQQSAERSAQRESSGWGAAAAANGAAGEPLRGPASAQAPPAEAGPGPRSSAAACSWVPLPRPGTAANRPGTSAAGPGFPLPRPGTSASRPGSARPRPGSAVPPGTGWGGGEAPRPGTAVVALVRDELLNDHPLILEYMARCLLAEGHATAVPPPPPPDAAPGSEAAGAGSALRGPSFAQRLRDTAATMSATQVGGGGAHGGRQEGGGGGAHWGRQEGGGAGAPSRGCTRGGGAGGACEADVLHGEEDRAG
jgi:hypothetical protein